MKLKIRQPDLISSTEIKQLPSKRVFLFILKKTSKQYLIPVKLQLLTEEQEPLKIQTVDAFTTDPYYKDFENKEQSLFAIQKAKEIDNFNLLSYNIQSEEA